MEDQTSLLAWQDSGSMTQGFSEGCKDSPRGAELEIPKTLSENRSKSETSSKQATLLQILPPNSPFQDLPLVFSHQCKLIHSFIHSLPHELCATASSVSGLGQACVGTRRNGGQQDVVSAHTEPTVH